MSSQGGIDPLYRDLFATEFGPMLRLATLLGADDPENLVQEAFVRLHDRWHRIADPAAAGGYLRTTVVNLTRSRRRHLSVVDRVHRSNPPGSDTLITSSAEDLVVRSEDQKAMLAALSELSARHREALVLRYWLDLSERDMADAMRISPGTVKSHVSRGLSALREAMAAHTDGDHDGRI